MKLVRTSVLKIPTQPIFSEINAASASVWNECLQLMEWYQWQRGYPHAHDAFWIGPDCEGWMDKNLSKSQPLHSQSIQTIRKQYFKPWKSYWELRRNNTIETPKPPGKKKSFMTTCWLKSAIRQIKDALHKHTATFVRLCQACNIKTVAIGDLTGIRTDIDYGKRANQKLHQWAFAKLTDMLTYKCKAAGIKVKQIGEKYTSQTCPSCGQRHKPSNRNYKCECGFQYHRDGVGAINIRKKYQGHLGVPVEAAMAPPIGIRLEARCGSA